MLLLWIAAAILMVTLYSSGLPGEFMFDDFKNISHNPYVAISNLSISNLQQAWNASPFEFPQNRPLAYLSFGLHHAVSGSIQPGHLKAINVLIHLISGFLVFLLLQRLLAAATLSGTLRLEESKQSLVATATAILWMLHPIQLTSVLYAVQRMTSLSGLFVILALASYVGLRLRQLRGEKPQYIRTLITISIATLLGALVKENALLTPLFILIIEWTLLRARDAKDHVHRGLLVGLLTLAAIILVASLCIIAAAPDVILGSYAAREFTLIERLLTETRILWMYIQQICLPLPSTFSLFHDDIAISTSLFAPLTTLLATTAWLCLLTFAILFPKRYPMLSFGVLFYLGGHALESTIFPLELAFEHRNYIPSLGPMLLGIMLLFTTVHNSLWQRILRWLVFLWIMLAAASTGLQAQAWSNPATLYPYFANNHPNSARANFLAGTTLTSQIVTDVTKDDPRYLKARSYFIQAATSSKNNMNGVLGLLFLQLHAGQPISDTLFTLAEQQLRNAKFSTKNLNLGQLALLAEWQSTPGLHKLTTAQAHKLFLSALANPTMVGAVKASIADSYRSFLLYAVMDQNAALMQAKAALAASPRNFQYFEKVIELELALEQMDAAEQTVHQLEQVAIAKKAPILGQKLVQKWRQQIAKRRATDD